MPANDNVLDFPTKEEIETKLKKLIEGSLSRDDTSAWALGWVKLDPPEDYDDTAWEILGAMVGANTPTTDRPYLYDNLDFEDWLKQLQEDID